MTVGNLIPKEQGNAKIIREVCMPILQLTLLRYEAIADFYSKEPYNINIKLTDKDCFNSFEQIIRVREWIPNQKLCSWSIYSRNRDLSVEEENNDLVLRNVIWKRHLDLEKVKNATGYDKKLLLSGWPHIEIKNVYVPSSNVLVEALNYLDIIVSNGISLVNRSQSINKSNWRDIEIMRLYDWGNITATWSPVKENKNLEKWVTEFCKSFENCIESSSDNIEQMDLDYRYPTEHYKNLICGDGIKSNS